MRRRLRKAGVEGLRWIVSAGYDLGVLAGAGLIAYGLSMIHPALAPIWMGAGILFVVARAQAGSEE